MDLQGLQLLHHLQRFLRRVKTMARPTDQSQFRLQYLLRPTLYLLPFYPIHIQDYLLDLHMIEQHPVLFLWLLLQEYQHQ